VPDLLLSFQSTQLNLLLETVVMSNTLSQVLTSLLLLTGGSISITPERSYLYTATT
jgi:hypothetical protein